MIKREEVISILENLKDNSNTKKVEGYMLKVQQMNDIQWQEFLQSKSIQTIEDIEKIANGLLEREEQSKFTELNEMISYGWSDDSIHIHVVPNDLHNMLNKEGIKQGEQFLIDALEKIQELLKTEQFSNIKTVCAISTILRGPIKDIFSKLGFETAVYSMKDLESNEQYKKFYEMFKDKGKKLGIASISRDKLFATEWNELKNSRKKSFEFSNGEGR